MDKPSDEAIIEIVQNYDELLASELGKLMPYLDGRKTSSPVDQDILQDIISSPFHDLFIAKSADHIVGTATISLLLGPCAGRVAFLEDFVVHPKLRGKGVANSLWISIIEWSKVQKATKLEFTSNPTRIAAHKFYQKHGATIRETDYFRYIIDK